MASSKVDSRPDDVSQGLRAARERLGISPDEAAKRCRAARSTYYAWEAGTRSPRNVKKIARRMETTVASLFGEAA